MAAPKLHHHLYVQVLVAIALGILVGILFPTFGAQLKPLGDGFVKLVKMLIAPIIFTTVVVGIASIGDMGRLGRVGLKALVYFEVVTTLALLIGLAVVHVVRPGAGMNVDPATLDTKGIAAYTAGAQHLDTVDFLLNIIPHTVVDAFTRGDILQVLLVAILFGVAVAGMGDRGKPVIAGCELVSKVFFGMVGWVMKLAPLGAFGAIAFTVGKYGVGSLVSLGWLMLSVYATCLFFVFGVLGAIAYFNGFSLWRFIVYIREELLIVLATSSSEPVLPRLIAKLEALGCSRPVVGLVVPTGYSFNLDGTSIYLTMAAMFVAQALNVELSWTQQATLLGLLMVTSKGAAAVTGGGFITLAATLSALPTLPVEGLALLLGVDRFMSEARALTNLVGNGVATIVVSRWEGQFDEAQAARVLAGELPTGPAGDDLALADPD